MNWYDESASPEQHPEVRRLLNQLEATPDFLQEGAPISIARAPGRLDIMGGIADYSGSLVLEMPLAVATLVAVQKSADPFVSILSMAASDLGNTPLVTLPLAQLCPPAAPLDYGDARQLLTAEASTAWAAYIAGVMVVLQRETGLEFHHGLKIFVHCEVPIGKGLSSSASLEVATMQAICALMQTSLDARQLALLCQKVENVIVGAPCGIMDQFTVVSGQEGHLLALLCQPAEPQAPVTVPAEIEFWGIDSGLRHAVNGSDYTGVRVGAFMGYRILAEYAGLPVTPGPAGQLLIEDALWQGYLANITPSTWERIYRDQIPVELTGEDFLTRYEGFTDTVTRIQAERVYAVRQPTAHPIYEHQRVRLFRALLAQPALSEEHLLLLGELMYQSHASYSACGLGSTGTDRLVQMVATAGPARGLYGAKITGGGSGGTVVVLAHRDAHAEVQQVADAYAQETHRQIALLHGTSSGAIAWGNRIYYPHS